MQNAAFAIPHAGCEHPGKLLECCLDAVTFERGQHDLGVAFTAKAVALGHKVGPQIGEIINLPIERHDEIFVPRQHRLTAGVRQINNREAPMAKGDTTFSIKPNAIAIRPAMMQRCSHRTYGSKSAGVCCLRKEISSDTA